MKERIFRIFVLIVLLILFVSSVVEKEPIKYFAVNLSFKEKMKDIQIISDGDMLNEYIGMDASDLPELSDITERFFNEKILIAISVEEPSEDITHEIVSIKENGEEMTVCVKRNIPAKVSSVKSHKTYFIVSDRNDIVGVNKYVIKFI